METTFYANESVNTVEGTVRVIMEVSCLERGNRNWEGFVDRVSF